MKLIIFDLDQTLIELFKFQNKAYEIAFKKIFNVKAGLDEIDFAGKTLHRVFEELALFKGIEKNEVEKKLNTGMKTLENSFVSVLPKNTTPYLLPGAKNLILELNKNKNNILALVTGNSKKMAREILSRASLLKYFRIIATGEHEKIRAKLVRHVLNQIKKKNKIGKIIVVGDSIRDVESGKAVKATTIAVLTGFHSRTQLKKAGADYILKNLKDKRIIKIING